MDAVLNWIWQGSVVALALAVLLRLLERARANVRYAVSWVALLLVLSLPAVAWVATAVPLARGPEAKSAAIVSVPDTWWTSEAMMLLAWSAWAGLCAAAVVRALLRLRSARARTWPFPSHVESRLGYWCQVRTEGRRPSLVLSESIAVAAVLGCGRPVIAVAPSLLTTLDAGELDRVLLHEWAHVQRRDDVVQLLQALVRLVAGWHPAVWWIERRLHVEREIACDEMTVELTGSPKLYAACLVKLAALRGVQRTHLAAPAVLGAPGLRVRVTRIVSRHAFIAPGWSRGLAVSVVALLCVVSFAAAGARIVEPAALALPFDSIPALGGPRVSPPAIPPSVQGAGAESARVAATAVPSASGQRPDASAPLPAPLAPAASSAEPPLIVEPPLPVDQALLKRADHPVVERPLASAPHPAPDAPPTGPVDRTEGGQRTPWSAAADGGAALGRKSKDAGVATAGFFTRFARQVAGSF